jgi:hypothetical protein
VLKLEELSTIGRQAGKGRELTIACKSMFLLLLSPPYHEDLEGKRHLERFQFGEQEKCDFCFEKISSFIDHAPFEQSIAKGTLISVPWK